MDLTPGGKEASLTPPVETFSDRDAVGNPLGTDTLLTGWEQQGVGHDDRPLPVLQTRVVVHGLDPGLDLLEPLTKPVEHLQRLLVRGPLGCVPLAQIHLVRCVGRQYLQNPHAHNRLDLTHGASHERLLRFGLQHLVLSRTRFGHEPPAQHGTVGDVPEIGVLPKVDGRVEGRGHPDDVGAGTGQLADGLHLRPPWFVLFVPVADLPDLVPPGLQLGIGLDHCVARVIDGTVLVNPRLDRRPHSEPVNGIRVVPDEQPDLVRAGWIFSRNSSVEKFGCYSSLGM